MPETGVDGPQTSPPAPGAFVGHPVELGAGCGLEAGGRLVLRAGDEFAGTSDRVLTTEGASAGVAGDDVTVEKAIDAEAGPTEA